MKYIKLSEARANFAELFDEVERGETIIITLGEPPVKPARRADAKRRAGM